MLGPAHRRGRRLGRTTRERLARGRLLRQRQHEIQGQWAAAERRGDHGDARTRRDRGGAYRVPRAVRSAAMTAPSRFLSTWFGEGNRLTLSHVDERERLRRLVARFDDDLGTPSILPRMSADGEAV